MIRKTVVRFMSVYADFPKSLRSHQFYPSSHRISRSEEFRFSDSLGIFMLLCQAIFQVLIMVPSKMADNIFKLEIDQKLGVISFCCRSLF